MAKVSVVDYENLGRKQAKEIRETARELNANVKEAYVNLENMHSAWYGTRYNSLKEEFNKLTGQLNDMLTLVVRDIPVTLERVANNYSKADRGENITEEIDEAPKKVENLAMTDDIGMRFVTSEVETCQQQIKSEFEKAKEQMDKIEAKYNEITWESEASEAFRTKFTQLKKNICESFENLNAKFVQLMEATKQDMQNTEDANTVG